MKSFNEQAAELISELVNAEMLSPTPNFSHKKFFELRDKGINVIKGLTAPEKESVQEEPAKEVKDDVQKTLNKARATPARAKPKATVRTPQLKHARSSLVALKDGTFKASCANYPEISVVGKSKLEACDKLNAAIDKQLAAKQ